MKRIKHSGCGYEIKGGTYTCTPIQKLHPFFAHTLTDVYAAARIRDTGSQTPDHYDNPDWLGNEDDLKQGSIDNYAQLPQAFEGFVMTLTPIIDMAGSVDSGPEVAELDCRINFDPFKKAIDSVLNQGPQYTSEIETVNDGFLNLYNNVDPEYLRTIYVDAKTSEQLVHGATTQPYYQMTPYLEGSTVSEYGIGYRIVAPAGGVIKPLIAGPGILEPMLDTSFPAIGVDTITGPDIIGDFTMWEFNTIAQWQKTVDSRLNTLNGRIPTVDYGGIDGLLNLENQKNKQSPCGNFQISIAGGTDAGGTNALYKGIDGITPPKYVISGGTITINGTTVGIGGSTAFSAPTTGSDTYGSKDFYLAVTEITSADVVTGYTASIVAGRGSSGAAKYVYIGRVTVNTNAGSAVSEFGTGYPFTIYEIQQGECIYNVDMPVDDVEEDYPGPFAVAYKKLSPTASDVVCVTGFDRDGTSSTVYAGKIYIDGVESNLEPQAAIQGGNEGFVYAHVLMMKDETGVYKYDSCIFDRNGSWAAASESDERIAYTFRLASISMQDSKPVIEQIHFGDLYVDTTTDGVAGGFVYSGPFHLETIGAGWGVYGVLNGTAGTVYVNGASIGSMPSGSVNGNTGDYVYANIVLSSSQDTTTGEITYSLDTAASGFSYEDKPASTEQDKFMYNIRLAQVASNGSSEAFINPKQFHFGDIYIEADRQEQELPDIPTYRGPFTITATGVSCGICPTNIVGYYRINGTEQHDVTTNDVSVTAANGTSTNIYLHVTGATTAVINTSDTNSGTPPAYTAWLGQITKDAEGRVTNIDQVHYGEVYVDGRWM